MGFVELAESEHAEGVRPVRIHCREVGLASSDAAPAQTSQTADTSKAASRSLRSVQASRSSRAAGPLSVTRTPKTVVFLHGGWGYGVYPIDAQVEALGDCVRFVAPDRSGYGKSSHFVGEMRTDFHRRAALETLAALEALNIERPVIWGHSDGAVIGAMIGLMAPERVAGLVLEAFHFYRNKPRSRGFFERFTARPEDLGNETKSLLAQDHGKDWAQVVRRNCGAWIRIAEESTRPGEDLYCGRLGQLRVPTLFLHGALDPRTEPDEMERVQQAVRQATFRAVKNGQHSPHSEDAANGDVSAALREFVERSADKMPQDTEALRKGE